MEPVPRQWAAPASSKEGEAPHQAPSSSFGAARRARLLSRASTDHLTDCSTGFDYPYHYLSFQGYVF